MYIARRGFFLSGEASRVYHRRVRSNILAGCRPQSVELAPKRAGRCSQSGPEPAAPTGKSQSSCRRLPYGMPLLARSNRSSQPIGRGEHLPARVGPPNAPASSRVMNVQESAIRDRVRWAGPNMLEEERCPPKAIFISLYLYLYISIEI